MRGRLFLLPSICPSDSLTLFLGLLSSQWALTPHLMSTLLSRLFHRTSSNPASAFNGANLVTGCEFRYQLEIHDKDGRVKFRQPWRSNMLTDWGIDNMFLGTGFADIFTYINVGNAVAPTPVRRDSAPTSVVCIAGSVNASGNFFLPADVGRLIKFNDIPGTEAYITGYISATDVTVSSPVSVGFCTCTIWYVNRVALDSIVSNMSGHLYSSIGGDNGTLFGVNTVTMFRKIIGGTCTSPTTLTEIGFNSVGYGNMYDLDIITGGVSVVPGDQATASCQLVITWANTTPLTVGNVATGYDSSGTFQIESLGVTDTTIPNQYFQQIIMADGSSSYASYAQGGPNLAAQFSAISAPFTQSVYSGTSSLITTTTVGSNVGVYAAYTNGSFFRDTYYKYTLPEAIATIYGLAIQGYSTNRAGSLLFNTPFAKTSLQTLDFTVRKSLFRVLVN